MRYSFRVLNNSLPEPAGGFWSEHEMKTQVLNYLLELARDEARSLPRCLSLVARDERGGVSSLVPSITD